MPAVVMPAPVGGWNARDPLSAMPMGDAVTMINMVSRGLYVETRPPFVYLTPSSYDYVHTLIPYYGTTTTKLIAVDGTQIYEISSGTKALLGTGFAQYPWQSTSFQALLIMTARSSTAQSYNGTVLANLVTTGAAANTLWGCNTFKGRVYYWKWQDDSFWYAAAGAYQGALTEFPLDTVLSRGGYLVSMVSMTMDSGAGADDLAAFIFSTGEVLIYQGDDPGSASAWNLVGKYMIPEPLGIRANVRIGANAIVMTRRGYVNLNAIMRGETGPTGYLSDKISKAVDEAVDTYNTGTPDTDQSDAVYCSKLNEVIFIHRNYALINAGAVESGGMYYEFRYSMDSGTWYRGEPIQFNNGVAIHHAIAEYNGALFMSVREEAVGVVDVVEYSNGTGSESISSLVQSSFVQPPQGGGAMITGVSVESSATYGTAADKNIGVGVSVDYADVVPGTYNSGSITDGTITASPWKSVSKYGRSFSVYWYARLVTNFKWYRSRVLTKLARPDR